MVKCSHPGGSLMLVRFSAAPGKDSTFFFLISQQGLDLSSLSQMALPYFVICLTLSVSQVLCWSIAKSAGFYIPNI